MLEAAVGFEEGFGWGFDFEREAVAGDGGEGAGGVGFGGEERSGEAVEPVGWEEDVVVGGDDDAAAGGGDAVVAGLGEAGDGLLQPVDGGIAGDEGGGEGGLRVVVDYDDLEGVWGVLEEQGVEAAGEGVGAVKGREDDGDRWRLIVFRRSVHDSFPVPGMAKYSFCYAVG